MVSQVFYRKWRPQRFDQVVGQAPVCQTLRQAVATGRVSHAYLFCGPRGTGKTSMARILAKAVNCLEPEKGEPCNRCRMCQGVNEGRSLDLIEMDAASHRGIDDIRNLRERVHASPTEARYKVYIIDEVHMLTSEAFNALLKTLEEPPPHAIFVLATTEAYKVPLTIISRCQRFDFRRIPQDAMVERLSLLCQDEKVEVEPEVLRAIARASSGSLRDAENLLEQLVVSYSPPITLEHVRDLFGLEDDERAIELVHHILKGMVKEGLITINHVAVQGRDMRQFHRSVVDLLRSVLLLKSGAGASLAYPRETMERLEALTRATPLERILGVVKVFGQLNLRLDSSAPFGLELALVESSLKLSEAGVKVTPATSAPRPPPGPSKVQSHAVSERVAQRPEKRDALPQVQRPAGEPPVEVRRQAVEASGPPASKPDAQWNALVKSLSRFKGKLFNIGSLLRDCKAHQVEGQLLVLKFTHRSHMERMMSELDDPQSRKTIKDAIAQAMGSPYDVQVELAQEEINTAARSPNQSHLVRAALAMGARIVGEKGDQPR